MSGDGLVRPVNAPDGQATPVGVQAGVTNGVQFARQVIVFGPAGTVVGIFVYAAGTTPGPGNLPLVSITQSATDPYGNTVQPGVTSYAANSFAELTGAVLAFFNNNAGGNTRVIFAPNPSGNGVIVQSTGVNPAVINFMLPITAGGGTPANTTLITTDTWNNVTPPTGFTGTLRYRLLPDGTVMVQAQLAVANTVAAGIVSFGTLSAPYVATADTRGPCGYFVNGTPTAAALALIVQMRWEATTLGAFQIAAFPGGGAATGVTELDFVAVFPVI
jgi:hypothetical protein